MDEGSDLGIQRLSLGQNGEEPCGAEIQGRVVLVTGGCGSIGAQVCRFLLDMEPEHLVILDNNESALFDLDSALQEERPRSRTTIAVGDVSDQSTVQALFSSVRPDVVVHAAAYKHVALMERFPEEALRVNVRGTKTLLDSAVLHGTNRFVLVSTDKAVYPTSVMGATKSLAELFVLSSCREGFVDSRGHEASRRFTVARLCNVLGTRGSVVPTFERQITCGGPVTLSDPDASRFFIGMTDAAALIVRSAAYSLGGDIFVPDVRTPTRITDLAESMIRERGLRPYWDIPILYTGLRPGEKLSDELISDSEDAQPAPFSGALRVTPEIIPPRSCIDHACTELIHSAYAVPSSELARAILGACRDLTPEPTPLLMKRASGPARSG